MDATTLFHPAFIVPTALGLIGFIAWLIRLEGKVSAAQKLETEITQLWGEIERHKENQAIHFNKDLSSAVERGNARRFETIESELKEIKGMIKELKR
jgi:hypothetical protein